MNHMTNSGFTSINSPYTQPFSGFATVSNNGTPDPSFSKDSTWTWNETNPSGGGHQSDVTCVTSAAGLTFGGDASCGGEDCNNFEVPAGSACFLTNIQGTFSDNSFTDGVGVSPVSSTTWSFKAAPGKSAAVYCIDN